MQRLNLLLYLLSILLLCSSTIVADDQIKLVNNDLLLWNTFRIQFGGFKLRLYDHKKLTKNANIYTISSDTMYTNLGEKKLIKLKVTLIQKEDSLINVNFRATFHEKITFTDGFGVFINNISGSSYEISNHAISEKSSRLRVEGYNNIHFPGEINFHFFNPLQQHMKFWDSGNYVLLEAIPHLMARYSHRQEGPQEDIRQIMDLGEVVEFSFSISKQKTSNLPMLSTIPNGHTEAAMMMWDEIPMGFGKKTFMTFTTQEQTEGFVHKQMLELLNQYPFYKSNILLSFDYFENWIDPSRLDTTHGTEHYEITGPYNITKNVPASFTTWLNNIENSTTYDWTNKVSLGLHSLHHTYTKDGIIQDQTIHEFGYLDSTDASKTFDKMFSSLEILSLTERSAKAMRFPGVRYGDIAWHEAVNRGIKLIDIGLCYDEKGEHNFTKSWGRGDSTSWGIKTTYWTDFIEGDTKKKYTDFTKYLHRGIPLLMGGHPEATLGESEEEVYKTELYKQFLTDIYTNCEDLTFLLPDSLAYFWDKLNTISLDSTIKIAEVNKYHLSGKFPENLTIVLPVLFEKDSIIPLGCDVINIKNKRDKSYVTLGHFTSNSVQLSHLNISYYKENIKTNQNKQKNQSPVEVMASPNPTTENSSLLFYSQDCEYIDYEISTSTGLLIYKDRVYLENCSQLKIEKLLHNHYGIFIVSYTDEKGRSNSESFFRRKKLNF